ncbi:MAG: hypothetical protein GTO45_07975, partial [Candidatus Aminicenantes bacterium]|nr:hypothetical protein [Candidatus Aminicenantes bacterium]NIM78768.1 hypothetical protein [Candidatus Aminicenantes bacterium]NIN18023.1 hypothetical protein [Candidatus Aminicenantes bacterium]NIN41923.1 hypothetical protein [Candidatus Aminicenantes bacterium]NIN84678.1 hypothetical protein [Candidatus Aminicenantes bacterium]
VPCICSQCTEAEIPHYFEFSELKRYLRKNENTIKCSLSVENVDIWKLIEEIAPDRIDQVDFVVRNGESTLLSRSFISQLERFKKEASRHLSHREDDKIIQIEDIEYKEKQLEELEDKITKIREELKSEEINKEACDKMAKIRADHSSWGLVGFNVVVLAVWAVLIFIVYDWNIMEPWTYLAGGLMIVINSLYFAIFKKRLNSEEIRARRLRKEKKRLYRKYEVNIDKIDRLRSDLKQLESQKKALLNIP